MDSDDDLSGTDSRLKMINKRMTLRTNRAVTKRAISRCVGFDISRIKVFSRISRSSLDVDEAFFVVAPMVEPVCLIVLHLARRKYVKRSS